MNARELRILIERLTTAWRPRDADGGILAHPAFFDLDAAGRAAANLELERQRALEAALDPAGLSSTGHVVLERLRGRS